MGNQELFQMRSAEMSERGYRFYNATKVPLHDGIEDIGCSFTTDSGATVNILADGHGGPGAAWFFTEQMEKSVRALLDSEKNWNLKEPQNRTRFENEISSIFIQLDSEYLKLKFMEFKNWFPSDVEAKPKDDGCTMIVNIILNGYLINSNLGDSRTILGVKNDAQDWDVEFSSVDHNTINPDKVLHVRGNGGYFVNRRGSLLGVLPNMENYLHLANARVYRPPTVSSLSMGLSHKRTLNLTGTLGDIHFKIDPPVLSAKPDVKFIPLQNKEYILIACTDGIWDYLKSAMDQNAQNEMVLDYVTRILENKEIIRSLGLPTPGSPEYDSAISEKVDSSNQIIRAASSLIKRRNSDTFPEIFYENAQRYDDATCQLLHIMPQ